MSQLGGGAVRYRQTGGAKSHSHRRAKSENFLFEKGSYLSMFIAGQVCLEYRSASPPSSRLSYPIRHAGRSGKCSYAGPEDGPVRPDPGPGAVVRGRGPALEAGSFHAAVSICSSRG